MVNATNVKTEFNAHASGLMETPTLWDVRACAKYLGKSPRWLWSSLTRRPEDPDSIPHVRVGKTPRFIPSDVETWVRQGCPPAATFSQWN